MPTRLGQWEGVGSANHVRTSLAVIMDIGIAEYIVKSVKLEVENEAIREDRNKDLSL